MFFKDIVGQEETKQKLILEIKEGRIPHAQLFCGPEGVGKLPLAIAYARYLSCNSRNEKDACGRCPSCIKFNKLVHPDLHFVFPVIKKKAGKDVVSDDYIAEWRRLITETPYFNLTHWLQKMEANNQQALIYAKESDKILQKLSLKSSEGGYKIMIIWLPEKMNQECSNKLLKILEEPPSGTVFLLITESPDMILPTIQSRTQRLNIPKIKENRIAQALREKYGLQEEDASNIARISNGNFLKALETIHLNEDNKLFFESFVSLMRLAYQRKLKELKCWSEQIAGLGRERQKRFLEYCQRMIRENFIYNFHLRELNYMTAEEMNFSSRFAPFIHENNILKIMYELSEAQRHIEQNVNPKMVFFDLVLKMIVLLKK